MTRYNEKKHMAAINMVDALKQAYRAYFDDNTEENRLALLACDAAAKKMLEPYYMEEIENGEE